MTLAPDIVVMYSSDEIAKKEWKTVQVMSFLPWSRFSKIVDRYHRDRVVFSQHCTGEDPARGTSGAWRRPNPMESWVVAIAIGR